MRVFTCLAISCLGLISHGLAQTSGLDAPVAIGGYLNGVLPTSAPGSATGWTTENAFPNLTFVDPLQLRPIPGSTDLLLVGKNGQIWRFANNPATTQAQVVKVLEWVANTQSSEDQGFYNLVFHPQFGQTGSPNKDYAYVCYNHKPALSGADSNHSYWRVSRFTWLPASRTLDPTSESVLINQYDPDLWHNGGAMFFDNSGFLNITCGDGGDSGAGGGLTGALSRTQTLTGGLFSGIFRIDVDNDPSKSHAIRRQPLGPTPPAGWPASSTQGYGIPNDNPFLNPAGTILEEYSALGLRSPHTAHYDSVTDETWVGDVGEGSREELSKLIRGDNAQWGYKEGTIPGSGAAAVPPIGTDRAPAFDYSHSVGSCVIGGMRYRGTKWATQLGGKLLYGDHARGQIWTANLDSGTATPTLTLIVDGFSTGNKVGLANFCTDAAGEIYLMNVNGTNVAGGTIRKLVSLGTSTEPPQFLSQTGIFTNLATLAPAPGVIPYEVATPLWSDGAEKQRWIALPNDGSHNTAAEKITFSEEGNWVFPAGTVFVKHFEMITNQNVPTQVKRLETRLLVCTAGGGKYGVTYKWNSAGTDAELLTTGLGEDFSVVKTGGVTVTQHWDYPSRADCLLCHNPNAGQALGVRTAPLNVDFHYPSTNRTANQLATFNALGMFDRTLTVTELENFIESRAIDDTTAPLEHRVRSYLDSNCSHCHRPGGTIDYFDARLGTPLNRQGLINGIIQGHFVLENGRYLKPGNAALSALDVRLGNVGNGNAMPPLAKNVVDQKAVDALTNYLNGLNDADFQTTTTVQARYVRLTALSEVNANPWTSVGEFSILDGAGAAIPTSALSVYAFDSQEITGENAPATNAIDGNTATFWHTAWSGAVDPPPPHTLTIDLGSLRSLGGYVYTPRQGFPNGRIAGYQVHYSSNATNWTLMDSGTWANDDVPKSYSGLVALRKARCEIAGSNVAVNGNLNVTIAFDADVTDFTAADLQVSGGTVTKLRGSGYYYVATISANQPTVSVTVPADVANMALLGNRASQTLSATVVDTSGPVPVFTGVPSGTVNGAFSLGIQFDEVPVGFSLSSLSALNANLSGLVGSGTTYSVIVSPISDGPLSVTLSPAGITDGSGNAMLNPVTASFTRSAPILSLEAESGTLAGGMSAVSDGSASGGQYVWLPDGGYPGSATTFTSANSASYQFVLPRAGNWMLEGLLRSADASNNSFWVSLDGGAPMLWDTNVGGLGASGFVWDPLGHTASAPITLINATTNNGSFETLGGVTSSTAKASHWDTDPDGDVNNWSVWTAAKGGPSTAENDSGTEVNLTSASQGTRIGFLQNGNAAYNQTTHVIAAGETYTYTWDWVRANRPSATAQLAYVDGANIVAIAGTATSPPSLTARQLGLGTTWTVPAGHAAIGHQIVMTIKAATGYPEVDNFNLSYTTPAEDPIVLNLASGAHTVTVYGREDGTRLDALRFTSQRPLASLSAPAVSVGTGNLTVNVSFSAPVTGLSAGDFNLSGASVSSLTGAGSSYVLVLAPTASTVTVSLPDNAVLDGSGNGNYFSDTAIIEIRSLFDQWAIDHGLAGISFTSDPNHDGHVALMDYLLNLDPHGDSSPVFDPAVGPMGLPKVSLLTLSGGMRRLQIEFPRNAAAVAAGYHYVAEFTGDLQTWTGVETGTVESMGAGWDHLTIPDPNPSSSQRYVRLRLVSP